jgi:hypothetical protein
MTDRRQFLWNCSALTLTVSLAPAACLPSLRPVRELTLDQISLAAFSAQVGTGFKLAQNSGATVSLKLVEAKLTPPARSLARGAEDARNVRFSLLFTGPKAPALAQDTYFFEHAGIGRFAMFIAPVGFRDPGRAWYQAVFNRPAPETPT